MAQIHFDTNLDFSGPAKKSAKAKAKPAKGPGKAAVLADGSKLPRLKRNDLPY